MNSKAFHRKLAAILSADVAGYSRLMQEDETATVTTKQAFSDLIKQYRGCVVDAVQCSAAT
jgi:adenylate cyclase